MATSWPLARLLHNLSEENYGRTFSEYRLWIGLGVAHGGTSDHQLYNDILTNLRPDLIKLSCVQILNDTGSYRSSADTPKYTVNGQLIHNNVHLLLRFITDAELDPTLSAHAMGLHDRLCRESLEQFFRQTLDYLPGGWTGPTSGQLYEFYTRVNLIAHWVNLGHVKLEDVRDHIIQSLVFQSTVHPHQLNCLMILLKISGATFAAYVDPEVMDHCYDLLKPSNLKEKLVLTGLAQVRKLFLKVRVNYERCGLQEILQLRESGWEGLPPPPVLHSVKPAAIPKSQDPAVTSVATCLGLPGAWEQSQLPAIPLLNPEISLGESPNSSIPSSPSTSVAALFDFTIPDSVNDEAIVEPETITPHDTFYLYDGSVEVVCGKTLFRVHASALSFHSPVLCRMFSPANLTAVESPNGCPRIVSSDTPADFATLLKLIYLPE